MRLRWRSALSLAIMIALLPAACQGQEEASDLAEVKERGKLIMVCFPHQDSEFVAVNLATGPMQRVGTVENFKGLDVDLLAGFAEHLGVTLEIRPISVPSYGELIPALLRGDGDVIGSSFSITEERLEVVDFSQPYFTVKELVITRKGSDIRSAADFAGKKAALIAGSAQEEHLEALAIEGFQVHHVDFSRDCYLAVSEGVADFTLQDSPSAQRMLGEMETLEAAFTVGKGTYYAFAVRKGSDLLLKLDAYITQIKESGLLATLYERHGLGAL